jgi:hypothetical protein
MEGSRNSLVEGVRGLSDNDITFLRSKLVGREGGREGGRGSSELTFFYSLKNRRCSLTRTWSQPRTSRPSPTGKEGGEGGREGGRVR